MVCKEDVEEVVSFLRRRLCATLWDQGGCALTSSPLPDVQKICRHEAMMVSGEGLDLVVLCGGRSEGLLFYGDS